jgi:glycosyltransferase involved in cell wall biosynthesis
MKLLWVKGDFLHPTTKGGQIRTLETLKRLHQWHEVHYVGLDYPRHPEALARTNEYCSHVYPIPHSVPDKFSLGFGAELAKGLFSAWPVGINRYRSEAMERKIAELTHTERFDAIVCDFLNASQNIPDLASCVLFQHNVEAVIWKRQAERAGSLPVRLYFQLQAKRMFEYERDVCRKVRGIIAVSDRDAAVMRNDYGAQRVSPVATGVDLDYFAPQRVEPVADLVFVGSMDWLPNVDGVTWFVENVLPLIRLRRPDCSLAIAGRKPSREVLELAAKDPKIVATGTVPDVRPYLWGSAISIVPLRIGGGTRLKIYESMAARVPVVSTAIGAEGLDIDKGVNIMIADDAGEFAERCIELLEDQARRAQIAAAAWELVCARYSWEVVCRQFERLLLK